MSDQSLLDAARASLTDEQALARIEKFIMIGSAGWADPVLLASLERLLEIAARTPDTTDATLRARPPKADGWHTYHICGGLLRELTWSGFEALCVTCGQWFIAKIDLSRKYEAERQRLAIDPKLMEEHRFSLVFEDGDGDLFRCSCGFQSFDFKQGQEAYTHHLVSLSKAWEDHIHDYGDAPYEDIKAGRAECVDPECPVAPQSPTRAMYKRLAQQHEAEPTVSDRRGGVPGDQYKL